MALFTYRPEFAPPWTGHSNVTAVTLGRMPAGQVAELAGRVAHGKQLPEEVLAQVVDKTDGVPLFVEELTKTLLESGLLEEQGERYALTGALPPIAIPNTLHDSLMARLDRLADVKGLAQMCASLGREFNYALLQAVYPWEETTMRAGLDQLVAAEFLYQQGEPPRATYRFKHALIQDAAYQSLLRRSRRQYNLRIAKALESGFPDSIAAHPELLAHHYTEADRGIQALPYWQAAGQQALRALRRCRSGRPREKGIGAYSTPFRIPRTVEAGIEPADHSGHGVGGHPGSAGDGAGVRQSLRVGTTGSAPHRSSFRRCGDSGTRTSPAASCRGRGHWRRSSWTWPSNSTTRLCLRPDTECSPIPRSGRDTSPTPRPTAGEGLAFYDPERNRAAFVSYGQDSGVACGWIEALTLWALGYPDRARHGMADTLARARELAHPFSVAQALNFSAHLHQLRREPEASRACAEEGLALCTEHGFDVYGTWCLLPRGWADVQQNRADQGVADIEAALTARRALGRTAALPWFLALLGEAYGSVGRFDKGLRALEEALGWVQHNDEHLYEAEVYRLKGELLLRQSASNAANRPKTVSGNRWISPAARVRSRGNCARRSACAACGNNRARMDRCARCWHPCTAGSTRASTPLTCRMPRHCWPPPNNAKPTQYV